MYLQPPDRIVEDEKEKGPVASSGFHSSHRAYSCLSRASQDEFDLVESIDISNLAETPFLQRCRLFTPGMGTNLFDTQTIAACVQNNKSHPLTRRPLQEVEQRRIKARVSWLALFPHVTFSSNTSEFRQQAALAALRADCSKLETERARAFVDLDTLERIGALRNIGFDDVPEIMRVHAHDHPNCVLLRRSSLHGRVNIPAAHMFVIAQHLQGQEIVQCRYLEVPGFGVLPLAGCSTPESDDPTHMLAACGQKRALVCVWDCLRMSLGADGMLLLLARP